ncbi:recombination protein O N-terminal domain-containing protein, partial [Stenotrophomonas sp. 3diitr2024]|uniref:recombination protein O N-terminal domain-containing protein n=1 Tax=Stenotrophomonas sp. 3diitr2024 TaxID=3345115 RepID=UPI0035C94F6E
MKVPSDIRSNGCTAPSQGHARAYRETSLLVEVLSAQHGRIGLLARGVSTAKGQVLRA